MDSTILRLFVIKWAVFRNICLCIPMVYKSLTGTGNFHAFTYWMILKFAKRMFFQHCLKWILTLRWSLNIRYLKESLYRLQLENTDGELLVCSPKLLWTFRSLYYSLQIVWVKNSFSIFFLKKQTSLLWSTEDRLRRWQ